MPASVADPVSSVLRTALSGKKGPFSQDSENGPELLEDRLAVSAKRVLLSNIEYEPAPKQQVLALDSLISKYIVLNSSQSSKLTSNNAITKIPQQETLPAPKVTLFRSEDVKVGWKSAVPVGAGMYNMGNTCYMNSTLQALFHVPSFSNWLLNNRHCKMCDPNGNQSCLICIISKTLQWTHDKSGNIVKPALVYNRLKMICKHMVHGRQEDAHEFMRYLLEAMEKAYLMSVHGTKLDSRSKETNPLGQIFGGYIRNEVTCLKCKHTSTTFQHFQDIPLDIGHASNLDDALGQYFRRERLEGEIYKCEKCKSKVHATKKFSVERAPNVLCIQLKRFGVMGGKMSKHIQFSRQLSLNRYMFNPSAGACVSYKFVSLINHMGSSQHGGHYTAIAEASNGQLYLFDDSSVRLISQNLALSTGAYVLIFEKIQQSNSSPALHSKLNGHNSVTPIKSPQQPKALIPRPAIISESRPKINFEFKKKSDPVSKLQLVIHNGAKSATHSAPNPLPSSLKPTTNGADSVKVVQSDTSSSNSKLHAIPIPETSMKPKPVLVPYASESDDDDVPDPVPVSVPPAPAAAKIVAETKSQVSPSPTPSENSSAVSCSATAANWHVVDSSQQDNSSSASGGSCTSNSKWVVRSLSDTETGKSKGHPSRQHVYHSDNETESRKSPALKKKLGDKLHSLKEKVFGPSVPNAANGETKPADTKNSSSEKTVLIDDTATGEVKTDEVKPEGTVTITKPAWDGSKKADTVNELLKMSHSGYDVQVRTWDGGKSHVTKTVEEDKRHQRKRTADEIFDEEFDKGKTKKIKTKEVNRDSSPHRNGFNPFQHYQDAGRNRQDQPHKFGHGGFKKDNYRNQNNRYGNQSHRGGKNFRRGSSDHHRPHSKNQSWRRFR